MKKFLLCSSLVLLIHFTHAQNEKSPLELSFHVARFQSFYRDSLTMKQNGILYTFTAYPWKGKNSRCGLGAGATFTSASSSYNDKIVKTTQVPFFFSYQFLGKIAYLQADFGMNFTARIREQVKGSPQYKVLPDSAWQNSPFFRIHLGILSEDQPLSLGVGYSYTLAGYRSSIYNVHPHTFLIVLGLHLK